MILSMIFLILLIFIIIIYLLSKFFAISLGKAIGNAIGKIFKGNHG